jgi:hypothetical protein
VQSPDSQKYERIVREQPLFKQQGKHVIPTATNTSNNIQKNLYSAVPQSPSFTQKATLQRTLSPQVSLKKATDLSLLQHSNSTKQTKSGSIVPIDEIVELSAAHHELYKQFKNDGDTIRNY